MNFLEQISAKTRERVARDSAIMTRADLERRVSLRQAPPAFAEALRMPGLRIIAEIKRASPSEGPLAPDLDPERAAADYAAAGAAAISVLTEPQYFSGDLTHLLAASAASELPCLMKDFVLDEYQLWQARAAGASAALLIVALVGKARLKALIQEARRANLETLVEIHEESELDAALEAGAELIGVNNRNLKTLAVDLELSRRLAPRLRASGKTFVAESGLSTRAEIDSLKAEGFHAFLIGTHLIKSGKPGRALAELLA